MLLIISIILILVIAAIAYPLFCRPQTSDLIEREPLNETTELRRQKESSYAAIQELQMDLHMGKLSEGDYQDLFRRYKSEALNAIQAEAEQLPVSDVDTAIEEEINRTRRTQPRTHSAPSIACAACGGVNESGSSFCHACGQSLPPTCPSCQSACDPQSRFCPNCGAKLDCSSETKKDE